MWCPICLADDYGKWNEVGSASEHGREGVDAVKADGSRWGYGMLFDVRNSQSIVDRGSPSIFALSGNTRNLIGVGMARGIMHQVFVFMGGACDTVVQAFSIFSRTRGIGKKTFATVCRRFGLVRKTLGVLGRANGVGVGRLRSSVGRLVSSVDIRCRGWDNWRRWYGIPSPRGRGVDRCKDLTLGLWCSHGTDYCPER